MRKIDLDELCMTCGHFTTETEANNGYGCNHPQNKDRERMCTDKSGYTYYGEDPEKQNVMQGKCLSYACPIADEREDGLMLVHNDFREVRK